WPAHRILAGIGENGADHRLLEGMDEDLPRRFSEMVLVSGDRIFAEKVSWLAGQGLSTTVHSHTAALAQRLHLAASTVPASLPTPPDLPPRRGCSLAAPPPPARLPLERLAAPAHGARAAGRNRGAPPDHVRPPPPRPPPRLPLLDEQEI